MNGSLSTCPPAARLGATCPRFCSSQISAPGLQACQRRPRHSSSRPLRHPLPRGFLRFLFPQARSPPVPLVASPNRPAGRSHLQYLLVPWSLRVPTLPSRGPSVPWTLDQLSLTHHPGKKSLLTGWRFQRVETRSLGEN